MARVGKIADAILPQLKSDLSDFGHPIDREIYARASVVIAGVSTAGCVSGSEGLLNSVAIVILSWVAKIMAASAIKAKADAATHDHKLISSTWTCRVSMALSPEHHGNQLAANSQVPRCSSVMAGLVPAIHDLGRRKTWMAVTSMTSTAMTPDRRHVR
jgi:hypothetical protein